MSVEQLIKNAIDGKGNEFQETFADIMSQKMEAAISSKYDEMFEEGYKKKMREEDDESSDDDDDEDEDDEDLKESKQEKSLANELKKAFGKGVESAIAEDDYLVVYLFKDEISDKNSAVKTVDKLVSKIFKGDVGKRDYVDDRKDRDGDLIEIGYQIVGDVADFEVNINEQLDESKNNKVGLNGKEGDKVYLDGDTKKLYRIISVNPVQTHPVAGKMRMYEIILDSGSPKRQTGFYSGNVLTYANK